MGAIVNASDGRVMIARVTEAFKGPTGKWGDPLLAGIGLVVVLIDLIFMMAIAQ